MKKLVFAIIAFMPAMAFAKEGKYKVTGAVGSYNAPAKMYLQAYVNGKPVTDSVTLKDGKFEFNGKVGDVPVNAYLVLNEKGTGVVFKDYKSVYLEKGTINVTGTDKMATASITGTKTNEENARLHDALKQVGEEEDALDAKEKTATPEQKSSDVYERKTHTAEKELEAEENAINKKFIQVNPDSYVSLGALESFAYSADYADIAPLYNGLTDEIKQSPSGKEFGERMPKLKAVALGAMVPVFAEADTSGKVVSLASFRGKYVLVDFCASGADLVAAKTRI